MGSIVNYSFQRPFGAASKRDDQPVVTDGYELLPKRFLRCLSLQNFSEFIIESLAQLTNFLSNSRKLRTCSIFYMTPLVNGAADLLF